MHYAQGLLRAVDQGLAQEVLPLLLATTEYERIASFDAGTALSRRWRATAGRPAPGWSDWWLMGFMAPPGR